MSPGDPKSGAPSRPEGDTRERSDPVLPSPLAVTLTRASPPRASPPHAPESPALDSTIESSPSLADPRGEETGPTWIGHYEVLGELGRGGMGIVYVARDSRLDRRVAIKCLLGGRSAHHRLYREALAMAKLSHPNVIPIYEIVEAIDATSIVMEYVEGQTLRAWQATQRPRSEILKVYKAAARGLIAAHDKRLVHRDFKPDNVMIGDDGRVRVMDFGLASVDSLTPEDGGGWRRTIGRSDLDRTLPGTLVGTPAYMSPEQLSSEPASAASDVFSFCVALYEALHGERPFAGRSLEELRAAVTSGALRETPEGSSVPPWLDAVLRRGLARRPEDRFESMQAVLDAIVEGELAELVRSGGDVRAEFLRAKRALAMDSGHVDRVSLQPYAHENALHAGDSGTLSELRQLERWYADQAEAIAQRLGATQQTSTPTSRATLEDASPPAQREQATPVRAPAPAVQASASGEAAPLAEPVGARPPGLPLAAKVGGVLAALAACVGIYVALLSPPYVPPFDRPVASELQCKGSDYVLSPDGKIFEVRDRRWEEVGNSAKSITCRGEQVVTLSFDDSRWAYLGSPHRWRPIELWTLLGCYEDGGEGGRLLEDEVYESPSNTLRKCKITCEERGAAYAGVQNGQDCWCGSALNKIGHGRRPDSQCNVPCTGDPSEMCGGFWRMTLYAAAK